jgi:hypothetical protein
MKRSAGEYKIRPDEDFYVACNDRDDRDTGEAYVRHWRSDSLYAEGKIYYTTI